MKKAFEMDGWVGSSLAPVMALMAQPLGAAALGLDKMVLGPYQWALAHPPGELSHAV